MHNEQIEVVMGIGKLIRRAYEEGINYFDTAYIYNDGDSEKCLGESMNVIPREERKLNMHPMDYEEFLWALGDTTTFPLLQKVFVSGHSLGEKMNRQLLRNFRLYMLIGGMPQVNYLSCLILFQPN